MKKSFFLLCAAFCFFSSRAQDTTLKEYVGTYLFPEGSFVPSADVLLKDTVLTINSAQGASDIVKRGRDTFAMLSYDGTVSFKRDAVGKVTGIKVEVQDVLLEGTKDTGKTGAPPKQPADVPKKKQ